MKDSDKDVAQIFDSFVNSTLFKDERALGSGYSPESIPHREEQIKQVAMVLGPSLRLGKPSNLFIYGLTGTGKTLVVQHVKKYIIKKNERPKS